MCHTHDRAHTSTVGAHDILILSTDSPTRPMRINQTKQTHQTKQIPNYSDDAYRSDDAFTVNHSTSVTRQKMHAVKGELTTKLLVLYDDTNQQISHNATAQSIRTRRTTLSIKQWFTNG